MCNFWKSCQKYTSMYVASPMKYCFFCSFYHNYICSHHTCIGFLGKFNLPTLRSIGVSIYAGRSKSFEPGYFLLYLCEEMLLALAVLSCSYTGERSATADPQPNGWCLASICAITCHCQVLGRWVSLRQKKPWRWAPVRMSVWFCLQRKLSCCCKCCTAKSWSQSAADSRYCGHKHWFC